MKRRKPARERKETDIRFRVTAEQKKLFQEAAARNGLGLSAWLVMSGMRAAQPGVAP